ncbi:hypothetical protein CRU94_07270 [Arcobacter sp. AHV-9/2010]|nr:hypothetical protein CRU94_07270 [Arcobacter sp. CECT 9299]
MKFHDRGFIYKYKNYTKLQVFSLGNLIFDVDIYNDKICKGIFKCQDLETFNKEYLSEEYDNNFLKSLLDENKRTSYFKDDKNQITIRVIRD